jgi:hypothetical protein
MVNGNGKKSDMSFGKILRGAIDHYSALCPQHSPIPSVAFKAGLHERKLQRAIDNEADLSIGEFANIMMVCNYPEGFMLLRDYFFPHLKS